MRGGGNEWEGRGGSGRDREVVIGREREWEGERGSRRE